MPPYPCIQHLRHPDLIPDSPCLAPQSQQQNYPKLDRHWGYVGVQTSPAKLGSRSEPGPVCLPLKHMLGEEEEGGLPLLEVCIKDPVGESLAADADPFQDTIAPQLVQHQERIHGSCGEDTHGARAQPKKREGMELQAGSEPWEHPVV